MGKTGVKGSALEERLRSYFWEAGYFALRGVPFEIGVLEVTDIDLWLYERPAAAARRRMIVDVKNKKRSKAVERIVWVKGLANILAIDNAIVAAKDSKPETELLAKKAGVTFFGSSALRRIENSKRLESVFFLSEDDLGDLIKKVDSNRRSKDLQHNFDRVKKSLVDGLGESSLNKALAAFGYFARQAIEASPNSETADLTIRLSHYSASLALLSLDFLLANFNFSSPDERAKAVENAVRFGAVGGKSDLNSIKIGLGLVSSYAHNGRSIAAEIESKFDSDAAAIPAKIISELVIKLKVGGVFPAARELHTSTYGEIPKIGDALSIEARSVLGAMLDYAEIDRKLFANALPILNRNDAQVATQSSPEGGQSVLDLDPPPESRAHR